MNRTTHARLRILASLMEPGKTVKCGKLADELEVSYKTVQRDLELARDQLAWPVTSFVGVGWMLTAPLNLCDCCMAARKRLTTNYHGN